MDPKDNKNKTVDSVALPLKTIFSDKYTVDFYQREYVWQHKQLEDLIDDLSIEFLKNYREGDSLERVQQYDPYYMGEIVLSEQNDGTKAVIDGQQRITTFTLLLMWIKNKYGDNPGFPKSSVDTLICSDSYGKDIFILNIPEREQCMTALNKQEDYTPSDDDPSSVQNLVDRYYDIEDCWNSNINETNINHFVYWLKEKVIFSKVWTNSDEFAYVIFETMNDRGLSLTQVEMLRSFLLANIDRGTARDMAMKKYDNIVRTLSGINLGSKSKAEFEFFKILFRSHYATGSMSAKTGDSDFAQIGKEFHRWVQNNPAKLGLSNSADYQGFIDRLKFFADVYAKVQHIIEQKNTDDYLYVVVNNDYNFTLQPAPILAAIKYGDDEETIDQKIKIVSKYLTKVLTWRVWGHWVTSQSSMEAPIYELCAKIRDMDIESIEEILATNPIDMPNIDEGMPTLNHQNIAKLRVLLSLMTEIVSRETRGSDYLLKKKEPVEVEHIWANHYDQHMDEFTNEQDFLNARNSIGDLLVLPKRPNGSYGDLPYEDKVERYIKENILAQSLNTAAYEPRSGISGFMDYINKTGLGFKPYERFTKESINERGKLYREILKSNWK